MKVKCYKNNSYTSGGYGHLHDDESSGDNG